MRFSEVLGKAYHHISLSKENQDLVDIFFTGSAQHLFRFKETVNGSVIESFHDILFREHLWEMCRVIYEYGGFAGAIDRTGLDLHRKENWNPDLTLQRIPDPLMYNSMKPDPRYKVGEHHPNDIYLTRIITMPPDLRNPAVLLIQNNLSRRLITVA